MNERKKILIVDDDINIRTVLSDILSQYDFDILEAETGETALELVNERKIDLVLLDTVLPGINGHETCRKLKTLNPQLKIIATTGKIDAVDVREAREAGADDYVVKTSEFEVLLKSIARLTGITINFSSN